MATMQAINKARKQPNWKNVHISEIKMQENEVQEHVLEVE